MRSSFVAIAALIGFLCGCLGGFVPVTKAGLQCPTAPVQTLVVKDCCGRIVKRAPRPGDRTFVQCACAEKKATSTAATVSQKITLFFAPSHALAPAVALARVQASHRYSAHEAEWSTPPSIHPPA